ncbi:MAG: hypothetical protein COA45_00710 [Zetaproteobacteria bacterium]|nr:MAG: hypothetical protein COA45_00710 [Zetaproteobacteria bacterium]
MISDEALLIYSVDSKGVTFVEAVPWSADDFEDSVSIIISKDCGGKPVLILNDMVEQHYRKEKVPRVSALDRQNIVKRKLKVAFPNYPVRAALPLKEKIEKTDNSLAGDVYIFAAVPASDSFTKTINATSLSLAPVAGFCLLPVESSDMIKKLSDKLSPKGEEKAQWTIFMGQHQNGGLRQIVIRNGELALTRMTPIAETDDDPVLWAKDVHQEFQATMSYLSRFGFDSADGLNVILISEPGTGDIVSELIEAPCNFYSLTSGDAADHLNLDIGTNSRAYHATTLHLAWIGRKSRFILPMKAKQIDRVSQPRQMAAIVSFVLLLSGVFLGYQMLDNMQVIFEIKTDIEDISHRKEQLDLQYSKEVKRKEDLGYNIQLIQSSLAVYDNLELKQINILPLFYNIGSALGRDMRIDRFDLKRGKLGIAKKIFGGSKSPLFVANMQMTFPSTTNAEKGNAEVTSLRGRLQKSLPDHVVNITKLLEDYEYSEEIVVETGDAKKKATSQDYVAEINIEGPIK